VKGTALILVLDHVQKAVMEDQAVIPVVKVVKEDVLLPADGLVLDPVALRNVIAVVVALFPVLVIVVLETVEDMRQDIKIIAFNNLTKKY
jgi:hypothetical protein